MALIKSKKFKNGATGQYWRPYQINWIDGVCHVNMVCYVDKATRLADATAILETDNFSFDTGFGAAAMDLKNPIKIAYEKIKASKMEKKIITPAVEEVKDAEGKVVTPAVSEVSEMVESNFFADATDDN